MQETAEPSPTPQTTPMPNEADVRAKVAAEYSALNAMFHVAARVLAIRFFLFLSLVGSFALSIIATSNLAPQSLWVLLAYSFVTTFPLAFLEIRNKSGG